MNFFHKAANFMLPTSDSVKSVLLTQQSNHQNTDDDITDTEDDSGIAEESECSTSSIPALLDSGEVMGDMAISNFFGYWYVC